MARTRYASLPCTDHRRYRPASVFPEKKGSCIKTKKNRAYGPVFCCFGLLAHHVGADAPVSPLFLRPHFLFSSRKGNGVARQRKRGLCKTERASRSAIASEEASSIPFPPGRRKLHIRSLLLPSQIVTVSLGHNLAIWNFTTPHAILMMAGRWIFTDTLYKGGQSRPPLHP